MPVFNNPEDSENGLQVLMLRAVPENQHGNKTMAHLAKLLHLTRWAVQKWVINERIGPQRVMQIVEISKIVGYGDDGKPILGEPRVSREDFEEYVYTD